MSKTIRLAFFMILMLGVLVCTATIVNAATPPTTAGVQVTLVKEDNTTAVSGFGASSISVKDAADQTLSSSSDYTLDASSASTGIFKVTGLSVKQTYYITFTSSGGNSVSVAVPVTAFSATNKVLKVKFVESSGFDVKKVGVIGGLVVNGSGTGQGSVTVKAISGTITYATASNSIGAYKLYVPSGVKYTLVIVGKDTTTDYKNISTDVTAVAGLMSGPITDQNAATAWGMGGETLGLTVAAFTGNDKIITGVANPGVTVSAYTYDNTTTKLTFLASGIAAKAVSPAVTGSYKITLTEYQPSQRVLIRAKDLAGNIYDNTTYKVTPIATKSMTLTKDNTEATIVKPIDITFADSASAAMTSYLKTKISSVVATYGAASITLTPTTQYTIGTGKITILAGVLSTAQDYSIRINATGYNQGSVTQTIGASITPPPTTLTGTFTVKTGGGTAVGSAQFSAIGTAGTGNSLVYVVSSLSTIENKLGNNLVGSTPLRAATDITGVAATSTKYIHVYEITIVGVVVKAKVFTLTAAQIKGTTSGGGGGGAATSGPISASSSALTSATGTITITLSKAIQGLTTSDIVVTKSAHITTLTTLTLGSHYNVSGENTNSIVISFTADTALYYLDTLTVEITKANFTINGGNPIEVTNSMGRPITATSTGIYQATGDTTIEYQGESFQDLNASNFVIKKNGVALLLNTDYTMTYGNSKITFLAHAALTPTSVITVEVTKAGYRFNNGGPVTVANYIYYEITGVSNGISSPTGTTTITLGSAIPGLTANDISVSIFGQGSSLEEGTDYTLSDLTGTSFTVTFTGNTAIGHNDVLVHVSKHGYWVNGDLAIIVLNTCP